MYTNTMSLEIPEKVKTSACNQLVKQALWPENCKK